MKLSALRRRNGKNHLSSSIAMRTRKAIVSSTRPAEERNGICFQYRPHNQPVHACDLNHRSHDRAAE